MIRHIPLILGLLLVIIACNDLKTDKSESTKEQIDSDSFVFKMIDKVFQDTLKQFDKNDSLRLLQIWDKGKAVKTIYYCNNQPREVAHYWIGDSLTGNYIDKNDSTFIIYPFSRSILKLYDKYKRITPDKVYKDSINQINVFNIPDKIYMIGLVGGVWIAPKEFKMKPNRNAGDSIKLYFYYTIYQSKDAIKLIIK